MKKTTKIILKTAVKLAGKTAKKAAVDITADTIKEVTGLGTSRKQKHVTDSIILRNMRKKDRQEVLEMMRTFYASEAVLSNGSDEIFNNDITECISDSPYAEGFVFEYRHPAESDPESSKAPSDSMSDESVNRIPADADESYDAMEKISGDTDGTDEPVNRMTMDTDGSYDAMEKMSGDTDGSDEPMDKMTTDVDGSDDPADKKATDALGTDDPADKKAVDAPESTEAAGGLLGYAIISHSFSTEYGKRCIWIEDLYLREPARGLGIGSAFLDYIRKEYPHALHRLEAENENAYAMELYRRKGFTELPYVEMVREIDL